MKNIGLSAILILASASSFAAPDTKGEAKTFDCMDKKTFEIKNECMTSNIESNLVFQKAQKAVIKDANAIGDRAMATMTFDSRTMTIHIVAHRDAAIAKADTSRKQK